MYNNVIRIFRTRKVCKKYIYIYVCGVHSFGGGATLLKRLWIDVKGLYWHVTSVAALIVSQLPVCGRLLSRRCFVAPRAESVRGLEGSDLKQKTSLKPGKTRQETLRGVSVVHVISLGELKENM